MATLSNLTRVSDAGVLRIGAYNTFNNPDNAAEDVSFARVFEAIGNETVKSQPKRIDILAVSETDGGSSARLPGIFNSLYGVDDYRVVTSSPDFFFDRTGFVYDSSTVALVDLADMSNGFTHPALRAQFRPVGTDGGADLYIYAVHLKSGITPSDVETRAAEASRLRADADALGDNHSIIYAGDFNMQGSEEAAWTELLADGPGQGFDAADAPGHWSDNPAFVRLHTQNARGQMLRRLDLQFLSGELLDGVGLDYVADSFRVFGNNGSHRLGEPIDTGTGASAAVLAALMAASDHLPVVADYAFPEPVCGDANGDGRVDATDLNILALTWRQAVTPSTGADFTGDGFVDAGDLNALALNWRFGVSPQLAARAGSSLTRSAADASFNLYPEPGTLMIWTIGGLATSMRRRRVPVANPASSTVRKEHTFTTTTRNPYPARRLPPAGNCW
jgi:hypothetical protein